jgi:hypothetical protein
MLNLIEREHEKEMMKHKWYVQTTFLSNARNFLVIYFHVWVLNQILFSL